MQETNNIFASITGAFQTNKSLADRAIAQVPDEGLHHTIDVHGNSIAIIMKHVAGNLLSRWTNPLTTDGEKPDRNRDSEFVDTFRNRQEIIDYWEKGWAQLYSELQSFTADDLVKVVNIRGVPHPLTLALALSLGHTCYHIGQIVQLAQYFTGKDWKVLTIPRGQSEQFNQENWGQRGRSHS